MRSSSGVNILLMEEKRLVREVYNHSRREFEMRNRNNWARTIHQILSKYALLELWENEQVIRNEIGENKSVQQVKAHWMRKIFKYRKRKRPNGR